MVFSTLVALTHGGLVMLLYYLASLNLDNIGSGNGSLPNSTKPLLEPMLTAQRDFESKK